MMPCELSAKPMSRWHELITWTTCPARPATGLFLSQGSDRSLNHCARVVLLRRIDESELPSDVFDRLHINASSSFILKNTEKVELDESKPFCEPAQPSLASAWRRFGRECRG